MNANLKTIWNVAGHLNRRMARIEVSKVIDVDSTHNMVRGVVIIFIHLGCYHLYTPGMFSCQVIPDVGTVVGAVVRTSYAHRQIMVITVARCPNFWTPKLTLEVRKMLIFCFSSRSFFVGHFTFCICCFNNLKLTCFISSMISCSLVMRPLNWPWLPAIWDTKLLV